MKSDRYNSMKSSRTQLDQEHWIPEFNELQPLLLLQLEARSMQMLD